jgi:hypothetical protein
MEVGQGPNWGFGAKEKKKEENFCQHHELPNNQTVP